MAYQTVMRFSDPERLVIEVVEPGRGRIRHDIRLGGIGSDGPHRFIETDEGPGREPRRFRIDQIAGATRPDGTAVDVREAILDAHYWDRLKAGKADTPAGLSAERHMRHWFVGMLLAIGLGAAAGVVGLVTGNAELGLQVFGYGLVAVGVGALIYAAAMMLPFDWRFGRRR